MNHRGIIPDGREIARTSRRDSRLRSEREIAVARRLNIMPDRAAIIPRISGHLYLSSCIRDTWSIPEPRQGPFRNPSSIFYEWRSAFPPNGNSAAEVAVDKTRFHLSR